jgi:hypothetical protein
LSHDCIAKTSACLSHDCIAQIPSHLSVTNFLPHQNRTIIPIGHNHNFESLFPVKYEGFLQKKPQLIQTGSQSDSGSTSLLLKQSGTKQNTVSKQMFHFVKH